MTDFEIAYLMNEIADTRHAVWSIYITVIFGMLFVSVTVAARLSTVMVAIFVGLSFLFWVQNLFDIIRIIEGVKSLRSELEERIQAGADIEFVFGGPASDLVVPFGNFTLHVLVYVAALAFFVAARRQKFSLT